MVTLDVPGAISALDGAISSKSISRLQQLVKEYEDLMEKPGTARQKLRLAKSTLGRLEKAAASGVTVDPQADAKKEDANAPPSPFIKESYDAADFEKLSTKWEGLKWRLIQMPGGAVKKPESYYKLYGFFKQASVGDNTTERPVWAERGGLDFDGRAAWDAWTAVKGLATKDAQLQFVKALHEFSPKDLFSDSRGDFIKA